MNTEQFLETAYADDRLRPLLQTMARELAESLDIEEPSQYITVSGMEFLFPPMAYALCRWLKITSDYVQGRAEIDLLQRRRQVLSDLIQLDHLPPEQAQKALEVLVKHLPKGDDDPALQAARKMLGQ